MPCVQPRLDRGGCGFSYGLGPPGPRGWLARLGTGGWAASCRGLSRAAVRGDLNASGKSSRARLAAVLTRRCGRTAGLALAGRTCDGPAQAAAWRRPAAVRAAEACAAWRWMSRSSATATASSASFATSIITAAWSCSPTEPALTELGQREVSGELPAAEPNRRALAAYVAGFGHCVTGHLAPVALAEPLTDQEPGRLQLGEELLLAARTRCRRVDRTPQHGAGGLLPTTSTGMLVLCPGWAAARGPVARCRDAQAVPALDRLASLADAVEVVPDPGPGPVLPREGGDYVNVIRGVPDRDPAHRIIVARPRQACPGRGVMVSAGLAGGWLWPGGGCLLLVLCRLLRRKRSDVDRTLGLRRGRTGGRA